MQRLAVLFPFLVLLLAATTAHATEESKRADARARGYLRAGVTLVSAAHRESSPSRKLQLADRALAKLHRAHAVLKLERTIRSDELERAVETSLISALNVKTWVKLQRGALESAKRLNEAALAYKTPNVVALRLRVAIQKALLRDVYEEIQGQHAINRLRSRHGEIGSALRDRGLARRR